MIRFGNHKENYHPKGLKMPMGITTGALLAWGLVTPRELQTAGGPLDQWACCLVTFVAGKALDDWTPKNLITVTNLLKIILYPIRALGRNPSPKHILLELITRRAYAATSSPESPFCRWTHFSPLLPLEPISRIATRTGNPSSYNILGFIFEI